MCSHSLFFVVVVVVVVVVVLIARDYDHILLMIQL